MTVGNRILWIVIGVLLTAAGVFGVLANLGRLPGLDRDRMLLSAGVAQRWHTWGGWATGAVVLAGLIVALLGFLLLRAQLRGRGGAPMPDLRLGPDGAGHTRVSHQALQHALTRDLLGSQYVNKAAVRLVGDSDKPDVLVRLAVGPDTDITRLHAHVSGALDRFETTSGVRPHLRDVVVAMADQQPARIH
jgi:hypothetical protein